MPPLFNLRLDWAIAPGNRIGHGQNLPLTERSILSERNCHDIVFVCTIPTQNIFQVEEGNREHGRRLGVIVSPLPKQVELVELVVLNAAVTYLFGGTGRLDTIQELESSFFRAVYFSGGCTCHVPKGFGTQLVVVVGQ